MQNSKQKHFDNRIAKITVDNPLGSFEEANSGDTGISTEYVIDKLLPCSDRENRADSGWQPVTKMEIAGCNDPFCPLTSPTAEYLKLLFMLPKKLGKRLDPSRKN